MSYSTPTNKPIIAHTVLLRKAHAYDLAQMQHAHQVESQRHLAAAQRIEFEREQVNSEIAKLEAEAKAADQVAADKAAKRAERKK